MTCFMVSSLGITIATFHVIKLYHYYEATFCYNTVFAKIRKRLTEILVEPNTSQETLSKPEPRFLLHSQPYLFFLLTT